MLYHCSTCKFDICSSCFNSSVLNEESSNNKTISVEFHRHPLVYQKSSYLNNKFTCEKCKKSGNGMVYHCSTCKFDLCKECQEIGSKKHHFHIFIQFFLLTIKKVELKNKLGSLSLSSNKSIETNENTNIENHNIKVCPICLDLEINAILIPCGHGLCLQDAHQVKNCPICRSNIQHVQKIFI